MRKPEVLQVTCLAMPLSDVDVTAVSNAPANPAGTQPVGGLFTIITQKWFALNGLNPLEVWTDYRRL